MKPIVKTHVYTFPIQNGLKQGDDLPPSTLNFISVYDLWGKNINGLPSRKTQKLL